ncbi:MAG: YfiR family protein [Verrucomicrobia bacterium]|nr:YfiR family protein [Verrucomicrobiota bacterium]
MKLRLPLLCLAGLAGVVCLLGAAAPAPGSGATARGEHEVKAAFLLNFARFVEWPATGGTGALVIGVAGPSPVFEPLQAMVAGETVRGRRILVHALTENEDPRSCQVLFVSRESGAETAALVRQVAGLPILTVGEADTFCALGGMINLFLEGSAIRFEVNRTALADSGLRVSSRLLQLARKNESAPARQP